MEKKEIRVLALDLDGTLTNDQKVVTPATRTALDAAAAKGVTIVLASGRPTAGVVPLARELELDKKGGCILSYNGGSITDTQGWLIFMNVGALIQNMCRPSVPLPRSRRWPSSHTMSRASFPKAPRTRGR